MRSSDPTSDHAFGNHNTFSGRNPPVTDIRIDSNQNSLSYRGGADPNSSPLRENVHSMTSEQVKHKLYVQPLMRFFHDCIDFERTLEINKQELVLCEDYSIYNVFKALAGPGKKYLPLCDL